MSAALATVAPATAITAAAAAVAAATAAVTTSATAAGWAWFSRSSLIHRQGPTFHGLAVELRDGVLSVLIRTHRHKGKAARFAGEFILHERYFLDRASL